MTKFAYRMLAAAAALSIGSTAHAAAILNPDGSVTLNTAPGISSFTVNYNGFIGSPSGIVSGLSSQILFNFIGTSNSGKNFDFSYTLFNTSSAPIDASRASIFGFNVDPNVAGATSAGLFPDAMFKKLNYNTPNAGANVELCFKDANGDNCTGGASGGVLKGLNDGGTFSLLFATAPSGSAVTLGNFYIRYQSIDSQILGLNGDSASGSGTPVTVVPEPAAWAMMIAGFGLVGGAMRRRRVQAALAA